MHAPGPVLLGLLCQYCFGYSLRPGFCGCQRQISDKATARDLFYCLVNSGVAHQENTKDLYLLKILMILDSFSIIFYSKLYQSARMVS